MLVACVIILGVLLVVCVTIYMIWDVESLHSERHFNILPNQWNKFMVKHVYWTDKTREFSCVRAVEDKASGSQQRVDCTQGRTYMIHHGHEQQDRLTLFVTKLRPGPDGRCTAMEFCVHVDFRLITVTDTHVSLHTKLVNAENRIMGEICLGLMT